MIDIQQLHKLFLTSSGVCTDTRNIQEGSLFFALKGANFDGNKFAAQAIKDGASFAIVDDQKVSVSANVIVVTNVLDSLQRLANYHRKWLGIPIIGITGTNGKTTTKELVNTVLSKKYKTYATKGNFNNHIGVPLTLLAMDKSIEVGIVEMGANHIGEIKILCDIAEPNYGLITNVGKAHIEGFGSFEGVKKTKAELYRFIESAGGTLFVNSNNTHLQSMLQSGASVVGYGDASKDSVSCIKLAKEVMLSFQVAIKPDELDIKTNLVGEYNLENALAAIAIGDFFKLSGKDIKNALERYVPSNNRSQLIETSYNEVLLDAYNANPSSMNAALTHFANIEHVNKVLILGEMRELGDATEVEHKKVLDKILKCNFKHVFLLGQSYLSLVNNGSVFVSLSLEELKTQLKNNPIKDALILVKGSRANKLEQIVEVL